MVGNHCLSRQKKNVIHLKRNSFHIAELAKQFAELVAKVSSSLADDDITENELHDCQREAGELIAAVQAALAFIQAMRARKADSLERRAYALRELS